MSDSEILSQVKIAIDLHQDGTYSVNDLYSHMLTIVKDHTAPLLEHKNKMERLIYKVQEMRENQRMYWGGHKNLIGVCKVQENEMDKKVGHLLTMGYNIDRFKNNVIQKTLL